MFLYSKTVGLYLHHVFQTCPDYLESFTVNKDNAEVWNSGSPDLR
jgi:hypothetical protein